MAAEACCPGPEADGLIILVLILIAAFVYWRTGNWLVGEAKAVSGHTIKVGKKEVRVRLHALNSLQITPPGHPNQPWTDASGVVHDGGAIATGKLAEQVAGEKVKVRLNLQKAPDPFGRVVGQVFVDCEDVGLWLVANGFAFAAEADRKYDKAVWQRYVKAEQKAKRKGLGFHSGKFEDPEAWLDKQPDLPNEELDP